MLPDAVLPPYTPRVGEGDIAVFDPDTHISNNVWPGRRECGDGVGRQGHTARVSSISRTRRPSGVLELAYDTPEQALPPSARGAECASPDPQPGGRAVQVHGQVVVRVSHTRWCRCPSSRAAKLWRIRSLVSPKKLMAPSAILRLNSTQRLHVPC